MSNKETIFDNLRHLDPKYKQLESFVHTGYRSFWTPAKYEKLIKEVDKPHFENKTKEIDQEAIRRCIMAVSLVEDKVKVFFPTLYFDLPQTIIGDITGIIAQQEVTHRRSYHSLASALGVDMDGYQQFEALNGRVAYLNKHTVQDPKIIGKKRVLKKLVLFTSLVERCSLFSQFYILMSFANANKGLKTISALQESTAAEETFHYNFGMTLIDIIKEECPQLWDEYLIDLVKKDLQQAYKAELNLISWFFEKGVPDHLTMEEVINFLNDNFNTVIRDLELPMDKYTVDEDLFEEKNSWFRKKINLTSEPDFFANAVSGYAADDEEVDMETFEF